MKKETTIEKIKEKFMKEMKERDYNEEIINTWLSYIE
jgi:DNA polymerase III alpha subunit